MDSDREKKQLFHKYKKNLFLCICMMFFFSMLANYADVVKGVPCQDLLYCDPQDQRIVYIGNIQDDITCLLQELVEVAVQVQDLLFTSCIACNGFEDDIINELVELIATANTNIAQVFAEFKTEISTTQDNITSAIDCTSVGLQETYNVTGQALTQAGLMFEGSASAVSSSLQKTSADVVNGYGTVQSAVQSIANVLVTLFSSQSACLNNNQTLNITVVQNSLSASKKSVRMYRNVFLKLMSANYNTVSNCITIAQQELIASIQSCFNTSVNQLQKNSVVQNNEMQTACSAVANDSALYTAQGLRVLSSIERYIDESRNKTKLLTQLVIDTAQSGRTSSDRNINDYKSRLHTAINSYFDSANTAVCDRGQILCTKINLGAIDTFKAIESEFACLKDTVRTTITSLCDSLEALRIVLEQQINKGFTQVMVHALAKLSYVNNRLTIVEATVDTSGNRVENTLAVIEGMINNRLCSKLSNVAAQQTIQKNMLIMQLNGMLAAFCRQFDELLCITTKNLSIQNIQILDCVEEQEGSINSQLDAELIGIQNSLNAIEYSLCRKINDAQNVLRCQIKDQIFDMLTAITVQNAELYQLTCAAFSSIKDEFVYQAALETITLRKDEQHICELFQDLSVQIDDFYTDFTVNLQNFTTQAQGAIESQFINALMTIILDLTFDTVKIFTGLGILQAAPASYLLGMMIVPTVIQ